MFLFKMYIEITKSQQKLPELSGCDTRVIYTVHGTTLYIPNGGPPSRNWSRKHRPFTNVVIALTIEVSSYIVSMYMKILSSYFRTF